MCTAASRVASNGRNGHGHDIDERTAVEVRAVPAPFPIEPPAPPSETEPRAPLSLEDELRLTLTLAPEEQRLRLIEVLRSCRFAMMREVQDLSGEQASTPWTEDGRTVKEIVGHIAGWERWVTAALDEIAAGQNEPSIMSLSGYPDHVSRYSSIDSFNRKRMEEARETPWTDVLAGSHAAFEAMIAAAERVPAPALASTAEFFWPDLGGTVPCGVYLLMVSAHHYQNEHLPEIAGGTDHGVRP